jgi:hypothetical protein
MTETSVGTDATIVVDVNLAAMAEGDYVFEVEIASGGKTARALVPFRVTR